MRYVALLRGINVGTGHRVEMKRLATLFEELGCENVSTYINSGNVIFDSSTERKKLTKMIGELLAGEYDFEIPLLVKTAKEMKTIADAIPAGWSNDPGRKTDVAYLFDEIDSKDTIDMLPIKQEFLDIRYVKGAIFWTVDRKDYNRSQLNKIAGHKLYRQMTVRNVNTARRLAELG